MDLKTHKVTQSINERVIVFIRELNEDFGDAPELLEVQERLKRISKDLQNQSLKLFKDENNRNNET